MMQTTNESTIQTTPESTIQTTPESTIQTTPESAMQTTIMQTTSESVMQTTPLLNIQYTLVQPEPIDLQACTTAENDLQAAIKQMQQRIAVVSGSIFCDKELAATGAEIAVRKTENGYYCVQPVLQHQTYPKSIPAPKITGFSDIMTQYLENHPPQAGQELKLTAIPDPRLKLQIDENTLRSNGHVKLKLSIRPISPDKQESIFFFKTLEEAIAAAQAVEQAIHPTWELPQQGIRVEYLGHATHKLEPTRQDHWVNVNDVPYFFSIINNSPENHEEVLSGRELLLMTETRDDVFSSGAIEIGNITNDPKTIACLLENFSEIYDLWVQRGAHEVVQLTDQGIRADNIPSGLAPYDYVIETLSKHAQEYKENAEQVSFFDETLANDYTSKKETLNWLLSDLQKGNIIIPEIYKILVRQDMPEIADQLKYSAYISDTKEQPELTI